jgi:hypothetical protein
MSAKMVFSAKIVDENGEELIYPISVEKNIPEIIDFLDGKNFEQNFHELETAILSSRKELAEEVTKEYLKESTKKKQNLNQRINKEELK